MAAGLNLQPQIINGQLTLDLRNQGLTSIPEEVFDMTDLVYLDVSNNKLTSIPEAIGRLHELGILYVEHNMLETLPHAVCYLPKVRSLNVGDNKLSFLPPDVSNMQSLEALVLDNNELKEIQSAVCRLPKLWVLSVRNNKLSSLPLDVEMMQSLKLLVISDNELTEVPPGVCSLSKLEVLKVARNKISILPPGVAKLQKLKELFLDENELTELPVEVCSLPNLEHLGVQKNSITFLPTDIKKMQKLTYLAITENKLTELPLEVCSLLNLESLLVGRNPIRHLPDEITHLTRLKELEVANCMFDEFPKQVRQLRALEKLHAGGNRLTVIPDEVSDLQHLQFLTVDINLLQALPSTVSNLKKLREVYIPINKFEKFPEALCDLPALEKVDIRNNQITRLPITLHRAGKLKELDVSGNPLTYPPQDICQQGTSAIMTFLKQEAEKDEKLRKAFVTLTGVVDTKQEQIRIARYLGVSDEDVTSIQAESPDDVLYQVLQKWREKWREKEGPETTLSRLTGLLSDMGLREAARSISHKKPRLDNWGDLTDSTEHGKLSINLPIIDELQLDGGEFIGRGAFAEVRKARHRDWDVDLAVKRLTQQVDGVKEKDLLYSEVKKMIIASTSPHIVDIRGICLGLDFSIVMTYMENGSLKSLLKEEDIWVPWALRWRIAHEISLGLNFLHCLDPQIIHCDVKAANVLLDNDFHAKIGDFGLAKWRTKSRLVQSKSPEGVTPTHAAPEHFQGREPDAKFDVYSFGITLWEILTRKKPYEYIKDEYLATIVRGGDRPTKAFLPDDTEGMGGMVTLMNDCWHGDPLSRPNMKDCCSSLAKGCASYTDYDMLEAVIAVKRGKDEKSNPQGAQAEPEREGSDDLK